MLIVVMQIPPRVRFNPFVPQVDLFSLFHEVNNLSKLHHNRYISFHSNPYQLQERINPLKELNRFLVLEMAFNHRYDIPTHRDPFNDAVNQANFYFANLESPVNVQRTTHRRVPERSSPASAQPTTPFAHVPKPSEDLQKRAKKAEEALKELGEDLPDECTDPISCYPLIDPIEINNRVYNRDTLLDPSLYENGQFKDPFSRELINPATAKSGTYMIEAMEQHLEAKKGKEPALCTSHKGTTVHPLIDLIEKWEKLLNTAPKPN